MIKLATTWPAAHRWKRVALALTALTMASLQLNDAQAANWAAVDIGVLPGHHGSWSYAVNRHGQVAGFATQEGGGTTAFLYSDGTLSNLGHLPGSASSFATGLNDKGQVSGGGDGRTWRYSGGQLRDVGSAAVSYDLWKGQALSSQGEVFAVGNAGGNSSPYRLYRNNGDTQVDLGNLGGASLTIAAINESGTVVGTADTQGGGTRGFIAKDGPVRPLPTLGGIFSGVMDINNRGNVVGWSDRADGPRHAFIGNEQSVYDLGTLGGTFSMAWAINDMDMVVGSATTEDGLDHAFLWHGHMRDLGTLGGKRSWATQINGLGQVIGSSERADGSGSWFFYEGGQMQDLQDSLVGLFGPKGQWRIATSWLGEGGHVAGSVEFDDGHIRSFLLSPVPEPATWLMALIGMAVLVASTRCTKTAFR